MPKIRDDTNTKFRKSLLMHGIQMGLNSISAIGEYLGYNVHTFREKVRKIAFDYLELCDIFHRLHYKDDEVAEVMRYTWR